MHPRCLKESELHAISLMTVSDNCTEKVGIKKRVYLDVIFRLFMGHIDLNHKNSIMFAHPSN